MMPQPDVVIAGPAGVERPPPGACALCHLQPREDDPTCTDWRDGLGLVMICSPCAFGVPARRWPEGKRVPLRPDGGANVRICAACRLALRGDERQTMFRLRAEDVEGTDVRPGALICCEGCLARWRPVIAARLLAAGLIQDEAQATGDWLL